VAEGKSLFEVDFEHDDSARIPTTAEVMVACFMLFLSRAVGVNRSPDCVRLRRTPCR
jgi:hypothetical protein